MHYISIHCLLASLFSPYQMMLMYSVLQQLQLVEAI